MQSGGSLGRHPRNNNQPSSKRIGWNRVRMSPHAFVVISEGESSIVLSFDHDVFMASQPTPKGTPRNKGLSLRPYQGTPMVDKTLTRPAISGRYGMVRGPRLTSHEVLACI